MTVLQFQERVKNLVSSPVDTKLYVEVAGQRVEVEAQMVQAEALVGGGCDGEVVAVLYIPL